MEAQGTTAWSVLDLESTGCLEGEENGEGEFLREGLSERVLGIYHPSLNSSLSF